MSDRNLVAWNVICSFIEDKYRETVVDVALQQLPNGNQELHKYAAETMNKRVRVPGFRSFRLAPSPLQKKSVFREMESDAVVAAALICLWAKAKERLIEGVKQGAETAEFRFEEEWTWQEARAGFYLDNGESPLLEFAEAYAAEQSSSDIDDIRLAGFWLNGAILESLQDEPRTNETLPVGVIENNDDTDDLTTSVTSEVKVSTATKLTELTSDLETQLENSETTRKAVVSEAKALLALLENADVAAVKTQLNTVLDKLNGWEQNSVILHKKIEQARSSMLDAAASRPDANYTLATRRILSEQKDLSDKAIIDGLLSGFEEVLKYDRTKLNLLKQIDPIRADVAKFQEEIAGWTNEPPVYAEELFSRGDLDELTLREVRDTRDAAQKLRQDLEKQCTQYRELSLSRIATTVERLQELDLEETTTVNENLKLENLVNGEHKDWPSADLHQLEQKIIALLNEQMAKAREAHPTKLAEQLQESWDDETFASLMEHLSGEKWDVETLMLLLSANVSQSRSNTLVFSRIAVQSLLRGLGQLSQKVEPFTLFGLLSSIFLIGWQTDDPMAQAELRIVFLASHYSSSYPLQEGLLWKLSFDSLDWPIGGMPTWERLWKATLEGEPVEIVAGPPEENWVEEKNDARAQAEQMMARDHGMYVRLTSIPNRHYHNLLRDEIMPNLLSQLELLKEMESKLEAASSYELPERLAQLEKLLDERIRPESETGWLEEAYNAAASLRRVDDSAFHRRASLRIIQECATAILAYGEALQTVWQKQSNNKQVIQCEALQSELSQLSDLTPLAKAAVERIVQSRTIPPTPHEGVDTNLLASQKLVDELLSQDTFALRLPRTIGYLTTTQLQWEQVLPNLLSDLAEPVNPEESARLLLEQNAPSQVLHLTQYISLDLQREAQTLKRKKESQVTELETELLKNGGDVDDLVHQRELGRWQLVISILEERLEERRIVRTIDRQEREELTKQLRQSIQALDDRVFEMWDQIPGDARQIMEEGLYASRRALSSVDAFPAVETYLEDLEYRLNRQAWSLAELNSAVASLERNVQSERGKGNSTPHSTKKVLSLMERGELRQLGIGGTDLANDFSKRNTRIELLQEWLDVGSLPAFQSRSLSVSQINTIRSFFSIFARMVRLGRVQVDGRNVRESDPVVFERWKLTYPKTQPLTRACVLIALPGQPPTALDLQELDHVLRDNREKWLKYYFVILFIPGCTPEIRKRLRSTYQNKGVVIIDEEAMIDMVLAEAAENNPLGRLRPLMLDALGEKNVDVFKVNQTVGARTAIFVGRDTLISRIASSGENYAIYGGRRIGKSSVLKAIEEQLKRRDDIRVINHSFEGDNDNSDNGAASALARSLQLEKTVYGVEVFKSAVQAYMDEYPGISLVFLLDEIDRYISANPERHVLIEALRTLSDQYGSRFRVVIAGFMSLYDCLNGRGPYTPSSDPWRRMLKDDGPLENLLATQAERIVREGFIDILGWKFANPAIPRRIVMRTGGHPAFVQYFCLRLQKVVAQRGDRLILLEDLDKVFVDPDPSRSFIAHVKNTLEMNLENPNEPPVAQYLILWLASEYSEAQGFTRDQMRKLIDLSDLPIAEELLDRALERLLVTSVIRRPATDLYEFSVPDYPAILDRLGDTNHLETLEKKLETRLRGLIDEEE